MSDFDWNGKGREEESRKATVDDQVEVEQEDVGGAPERGVRDSCEVLAS